jgi:hypothetical protein
MSRLPLLESDPLLADFVTLTRAYAAELLELEAWDAFRTEQLEPVVEPEVVDELEGSRCSRQSCGGCGRCS